MRRWQLLLACAIFGGVAVSTAPSTPTFSVVEATIPDLQAAMKDGRLTSRELVTQDLMRIAMYENRLHATLAVNAHALEEADALDRERAQGRVRGPLHGIPIALKDNIHTRHPPDDRPHQPLWRHSDNSRPRHGGSDDADRGGRRDSARRARRRVAGSARSGDDDVHAAAGARLHEVPAGRRVEGRAYQHPARVLLRPHHRSR